MSEKYCTDFLADIKKEISYNQETGVFSWNVTRDRVVAGMRAGTVDPKGYRRIRYKRQQYFEHLLAFFYVHGKFPAQQIDHINGDRADNRISNIREVSCSENAQNRWANKRNKTGLMGVNFNFGKYRAFIRINNQTTCLGNFETAHDAHEAYKIAKAQHHKFFNANRMTNYDL